MDIFDFAIIGAGAAGLHLAMAMLDDVQLNDHRILVLDKDPKDSDDRTWCFWETDDGKWDDILTHSWIHVDVFSPESQTIALNISPYRYKMIRSSDFYRLAKNRIDASKNIEWVQQEVTSTSETNELVELTTDRQRFTARQVFDSRLPPEYFNKADNFVRILQHFKGWWITTAENVFDPDRFTMMDFRLRYGETTSFTYVLPVSPTEALVEFTLFTPALIQEEEYDHALKSYLGDILRVGDYMITEEERGVIPMTDFPFHEYSTNRIIKIGTAGSWVKPSTGYSFKNAERNSAAIVENIVSERPPDSGLIKKRFRKYDEIFLHVLNRHNDLGPRIFTQMYARNSCDSIFRFLDETSSLTEEVRILRSLPTMPFLRSALKLIGGK